MERLEAIAGLLFWQWILRRRGIKAADGLLSRVAAHEEINAEDHRVRRLGSVVIRMTHHVPVFLHTTEWRPHCLCQYIC